MPKKIGKSGKKKRPTTRQAKLVKHMVAGKTQTEAAVLAGYSRKNPRQSAHQAIKQLRKSMPEVLETAGLTNECLIDNYLLPLMNANDTKFFPYMKTVTTVKGRGKDKVETQEEKQIVTPRTVTAWAARRDGLDMAFKLKGSYAPKTLEEAQVNVNAGVRVVIVDMPRPPRTPSQPVIPVIGSGNGDKPTD
jgi:hypothetical protein